jgi:hypothetical protein
MRDGDCRVPEIMSKMNGLEVLEGDPNNDFEIVWKRA